MDKKNKVTPIQEIMNLRDNLGTLFLFSLLGIFLPLFMMLLDYEKMMQYRSITYIIILVGWMLVLGQLYFNVVNLMKSSDNLKKI